MTEPNHRAIALPPDQEAIRAKCFHPSGHFVEFPREDVEKSIPERFEKIVAKHPNRIAVKGKKHALTYTELNAIANRVANAILAACGEGSEPVTLLFEQSESAIVAILGALKAGKIYVPISPSQSHAEATSILEDSQSRLIITDNDHFSLAGLLSGASCQVIQIESTFAFTDEEPGVKIPAYAIAYIIYTSGSTGNPKGVTHSHRNVLHHIMNFINRLHICPADRLISLHSFAHSAARLDIFAALLSGAAVYPFDVKEEGLAPLEDWLSQEEISIFQWIPAGFRHFTGALSRDVKFPDLRLVVLGSEPVYSSDLELFKRLFTSDCVFVNRLGTTETGNLTMYFADRGTSIDGSNLPVGHPLDGMEVLLLDDAGQEVDKQRVGEITVRSRYLSPGYWQKPELTATTFLPAKGRKRLYRTGDLGRMGPNGCLEHVGRKRFQAKVRGYRVEISPVEATLLDLDAIKDAAIVVRKDRNGDESLVAYFVPRKQPPPTNTELRALLTQKLPAYAIPSVFIMLNAMPLTSNGKVDRNALPAPDQTRPELENRFVEPRTPVEKTLAGIWAEVLELEKVGIYDNFFELGGHSLLATRLMARIQHSLQSDIPLHTLFERPTIAEFATVIAESQARKNLLQADVSTVLTKLESISEEEAKEILESMVPPSKA